MINAHTGLAAFDEDAGTLRVDPDSQPMPLVELQKTHRSWRKTLKKRLGNRPLVWFVDDEHANRAWFVENHQNHFALLTFSNRRHVAAALTAGTLCDAVVTDVFFPAKPPRDDAQADHLLTIYNEIYGCTVSDLPRVWDRWKGEWSLDGFDIARDVAEHAARCNERIPVLLFSRKATLLLSCNDWLVSPSSAVENTHWMLEKLDPSEAGESASRATRIQRDRINAMLRYRRQSAPWLTKQLGRLSIGWGPVRYSLRSAEEK
ncbi:MAG: hypothetical protein M1404_05380 [Acidobacteria bacterium]|nr:hypothetical protein [Acidobacteriota bacterium]